MKETTYTDVLKEFLKGRRNVSKKVFKIMNSTYRAVENGRTTWESFERHLKKVGVSNAI